MKIIRKILLGLVAVFFACFTLVAQNTKSSNDLQPKTTSNHPMQYFVSLPNGWVSSKKWPVVIILEAAEKEYKLNLERFISARGEMPFVLVAPIHTNNGNQGRRDPGLFPYSIETWDYMDKIGDCKFNDEGIRQIMVDIQKLYNGEEKVFITGFEAGTHCLWSIVFNHPEYLRAAAPVAGNYRGRCVDANTITKNSSKTNLPIMAFAGDKDEVWGPKSGNVSQWYDAKKVASQNGFNVISETIVADKGHVPLPDEVLRYFYQLLNTH